MWQEATAKDKALAPKPRGLYPVNMTPFIENGIIYGVDQPGMFRAVELETGKKLWFTFKPVIGKEEEEDFKSAGSGTAFVVKNGDRFFLFAETGDLIIAKLSPKGYEEVSRAKMLEPDRRGLQPQGRLEPPGVREQVRLHPQRQGDHLRYPGGGVKRCEYHRRPTEQFRGLCHFQRDVRSCDFLLPLTLALSLALPAPRRPSSPPGPRPVDITPPRGCPMAGYYSVRGAEGTHDPLFAKALVFEKDGIRGCARRRST